MSLDTTIDAYVHSAFDRGRGPDRAVIVAAGLWGWLPAILSLVIGVANPGGRRGEPVGLRDRHDGGRPALEAGDPWFLKFAEISTRAEEFVEAATMNPAFEESALSPKPSR